MSTNGHSVPVKLSRRQCIPVIYVKGTHYEIGYDIGRNFKGLIKDFLSSSIVLRESLKAYETPIGKKNYEESVKCVTDNFPQYIDELRGIADGADVDFYKLYLFHMDDIISDGINDTRNDTPTGCTAVIVNNQHHQLLGHNEDMLPEVLNHYYIVCAEIIEPTPRGRFQVKEEKFSSLCYAGHLPGYTSGYNRHGLIFSINTIQIKKLYPSKIPRHFMTRALLAAKNFAEVENVIALNGIGLGSGCNINLVFVEPTGDTVFHVIEVGPPTVSQPNGKIKTEEKSQMFMKSIKTNESHVHANRYLYLDNIQEIGGRIMESSICRHKTIENQPNPSTTLDVINILGDTTGTGYHVFCSNSGPDEVSTINTGIFDLQRRVWSLYSDNPKTNEPLAVLPLIIH